MPAALGKGPLTLNLRQQVTRVSGSGRLDGKEVVLEDLKLRGERISFRLAGKKAAFAGKVNGKLIEGEVEANGARTPWSARLVK